MRLDSNINLHTATSSCNKWSPSSATTCHSGSKQKQQQEQHRHRRQRRKTTTVKLSDFTCIDEPHPYGILPNGNSFFSSTASPLSSTSARPSIEIVLGDKVWQSVLGFCDGPTLGRVVQTSKYHYAVGHQPELWRDLVLRLQQQRSTRTAAADAVLSEMGPSWRDTYVLQYLKTTASTSTTATKTSYEYRPHQPIAVSGVYSDMIYRTHLCRSFAIPQSWLDKHGDGGDDDSDDATGNAKSETGATGSTDAGVGRRHSTSRREVPRVHYRDLEPTTFFDRYEKQNQPVIVAGACDESRAVRYWSDPKYLLDGQEREEDGAVEGWHQEQASSSRSSSSPKLYRATSGAAPLPGQFTLKAYQQYCTFPYLEESPLYLFDRTAFESNPQWSDDFFPEFYKKCPYWDPTGRHPQSNDNGDASASTQSYGHDLLQHLGSGRRPDHRWMILGPKRSGSVFHIDPNATHAYNACVSGRKRWIFYPPDGPPPPGIFPSEDGDEVALPLSVGEWLIQFWAEHMEQYTARPTGQRPMECTTHPGDVIFVPHGWWHSVINLDETNIAVTHNYVSPSNLGNVLRFFQHKQDQISGCRDRSESVKPEQLYDEFVRVLKDKEPMYLSQALEQKGWTCKAWKEDKKTNAESTEVKSGKIQDDEDHATEKDTIAGVKCVMAKTERVEAFSFSFLS